MRRALLLLALLAFGLAGPARAQLAPVLNTVTGATTLQPAATNAPSATDLQDLVTTLQNDKQRAQLISQLQALIQAQKAAKPPAPAAPSIQRWTDKVIGWFQYQSVRRLAGDLAAIAFVIVIAFLIWLLVSAAIRRALGNSAARSAQVSARLKTLLPLARSIVLVAIVTIAGIIVLSQLGMNIAPLLAGAGIIGIAIGLGSQQLVRDIITGLFILAENTVAVGDYVDVGGGHAGNVEELSIRSMRLRDGNGAVHTVPFSSVTMIVNTNRGIGNAAVNVSIAPGQDVDRAARILAEIAAAMRQEPVFKQQMLSELQYWGVDKVDGSSVTLAGQIVCTDGGRWPVQREFNRRVVQRFQAEGIALAVPTQSVIVHEPEVEGRAAEPPPQVTPFRAPRDRG